MARIKTTTSKNSKSYSIIEDYNRNGKRTTRVIDHIGNYKKVSDLAIKDNLTIDEWLNNYLNNFLINSGKSTASPKIIIEKYTNKLIPANQNNRFNIGYLFIKDIYYSLKISKIINDV